MYSSIRVVTSQNVIRAALFLVGASAAMAGMFLLLSAEFVALALILVYIGAVIVLFLFGVMITRAPMGRDVALDHPRKVVPALVSAVSFGVLSWGSLQAFASTEIEDVGEPTSTVVLGESLAGSIRGSVRSGVVPAARRPHRRDHPRPQGPDPRRRRNRRIGMKNVVRQAVVRDAWRAFRLRRTTHHSPRTTHRRCMACCLNQFLVLGALLFSLGVYGLLVRRNAVMVLLAIELMLNAVNINLIAFEAVLRSPEAVGQVFAVFVITVAAAEVGIGLAIVLLIFRNRATANVDDFDLMRW